MDHERLFVASLVTNRGSTMFRKGTRLFSSATVLLVVVAVLHTMGVFNEPSDEGGLQLVAAMQAYTVEVGAGMRPSVYDIQMGLALTMTVFLVFLGILDAVILHSSPTGLLLRRAALVNAGCMWALVILYWVYQIFPPFFSFVVVGLVFTIAYLMSLRLPAP